MSLNKSIVEDAALEWFHLRQCYGGQVGELVPQSREIGRRPHLAPGEPAAERDSFGEVVLVERLRKVIRRLNPFCLHSRTLATLRDTLLPKQLSGEVSFPVQLST